MWSAKLLGSRKQSLSYHLFKPFNFPVLLEHTDSYLLLEEVGVCNNVYHLGGEIQPLFYIL